MREGELADFSLRYIFQFTVLFKVLNIIFLSWICEEIEQQLLGKGGEALMAGVLRL